MATSRKIKRSKAKQTKIYKVMPLLSGGLYPEVGNLLPDGIHTLDTDLDDCVVVSVPTSTSQSSANELKDNLSKVLKKNVIVITHNVHFCCVERVTDRHEIDKLTDRLDRGVEVGKQVNYFGSGSGVRQNRLCDPELD